MARYAKRQKVVQVLLVSALMASLLAGCGGQGGNEGSGGSEGEKKEAQGQQAQSRQGQQSQGMKQAGNGDAELLNEAGQAIIKFENVDGKPYADAQKMAGVIGFNTDYSEDGKTLMIGDHDVVIEIKDGSRAVTKEEKTVQMDAPAKLRNGRMFVPASALKPLFNEEAVFTVDATQAAIFPQPPLADPAADAGQDFQDDPADPSKSEAEAAAWMADEAFGIRPMDAAGAAVPAIANASGLIRDAKRYLGVKYKFSAGHYSQTKRFDCSSFVRYLLAKRGISMPRTARAQAAKGVWVPRSKLRVGDLMYFYVPGRFKSNKKVGHVGIYMGNRQMIHASPLPKDGVQITNIDKKYWKDTFLYAKRIP